jgi:hypothetical protein
LVLSILATAGWVIGLVVYATDEDFRREIDGETAMIVLNQLAAFLT